ncbi:STAS domain-containing protein [Streptomyces sp. TRM 70351]|uniref:STAS domain-containing protein n=1 Tax=Streptomyces sp. TRM 70351 TaxID=3116552 RepID=UPI002E7B36DC|nr:STAS domain-containing protein [Streptomyces sp. TRM 70351]MEE1930502.1 STAS domain-containing protein [Streptomyces sp. TRM 70351]
MTAPAPRPLQLTPRPLDAGTLRIALGGDLDYDSADHLTDVVTRQLAVHGGAVRHLRLDCAELGTCDSMGLAALLMVHRRTTEAGVLLHLDRRPPSLERLLTITGTLGHLVGGAERAGPSQEDRVTRDG